MSGLKPIGNTWKKFLWKIRRAPQSRKDDIIQFLIDSAEMIIGQSKRKYLTKAPPGLSVRTNRLRSSLSRSAVGVRGTKYIIFMGTNVFYGKYWEEGHYPVWSKGVLQKRPFLMPAFMDKKSKIKANAKKIGVKLR